jgi:hypothetical protein
MAKKVWTPAARRAFAEKMRKARAVKGGQRKRRANPANKNIRKAIAYAYPSSTNAQKLGVSRTGGYYVERSIMREDGTWSAPYIAPDGGQEAFQKIDDPELLAIFHEADGVVSPYSMNRRRYNNPRRAAVHTKKFDRTVRKVKRSLKRRGAKGNAYAIAESTLGEKRSIRKAHRRRNPSQHFIIGVRTPEGLFYVTRGAGVLTSSHAKANRYATIGAAQGVGETLARWVPRNYKVAVYRDR